MSKPKVFRIGVKRSGREVVVTGSLAAMALRPELCSGWVGLTLRPGNGESKWSQENLESLLAVPEARGEKCM
jgi:hypothetical protein